LGADYYIYTEVKRKDNSWHVLNGQYYNESKNCHEISETYWSGSRTYFSRTYNKLKDVGSPIKPSELSSEVLAKEDWLDDIEYDCVVSVSLNNLRKAIPKTIRHQCCGYVHKSQIWDYEIDGGEIDTCLSAEEYDELSDAEKKEYEFYEWDDPMGWYLHLKEIVSIVNFQVDEYMRVNHMWNEPDDIRIVCIASY
jgi:hypothetical protein